MVLSREVLDSIVSWYFASESITEGVNKKKPYIRYAGRFIMEDTAKAHEEMMERLKPDNIAALFRMEEGQQVIYLVEGMPRPGPSRPWINLVLFILTFISVLISGALYSMGTDTPSSGNIYLDVFNNLGKGLPFAISLLAILASHEFGHYLAGRYHHTTVTLPFFIPFPFSAFGTMGAFIQMKEVPRNRNHLLDIGLAGPLAGLIVAIPVLIIGLSLSKVSAIPAIIPTGQQFQIEGNSILYLFLKFITKGQLLPSPATYGALGPALYWLRYFFTGLPIPLGGSDVMLHPIAWAGWAGLLVTSLNLIPAGQLDGGHIFYVLFGSKGSRRIFPFILLALVGLGFAWNGWWIWAVLILLVGRTYAEPLDQITPLDNKRKFMAWLALIIFILVFIPVPLILIGT
jgi:membrane-associated protease RseP (regulator of RpoE activity)